MFADDFRANTLADGFGGDSNIDFMAALNESSMDPGAREGVPVKKLCDFLNWMHLTNNCDPVNASRSAQALMKKLDTMHIKSSDSRCTR